MSKDLGKWAEGRVRDWLEKRSAAETGFAFHRYPDAKAARGALAAQPADFLVGRPWGWGASLATEATHLEVKETAQERRLPKAKVSQYGKLLMFHNAHFRTRVLVYRSHFNDWVYFTEKELFAHEVCPTSFPFTDLRVFANEVDALEEIFS